MSSEEEKLEVSVKYGQLESHFVGTVDEVLRGVIGFISKVCPTYDLASRLVMTVDVEKLIEDLEGIIAITEEGLISTIPSDLLSDKEAIRLQLIKAYLGYRLARWDKETMSLGDIITETRGKTGAVAGRLSEMVSDGLVKRVGRGEYQITTLGIKDFCETVLPKIKSPSKGEKKIG
jgi:hypothetical protein